MNTNILQEIRNHHAEMAEEFHLEARTRALYMQGLDAQEKTDLRTHERFVSELDRILATNPRP